MGLVLVHIQKYWLLMHISVSSVVEFPGAVVSLPKPAPGYSTTLFTLMHIHFIDKIKLILYPPPEFFTIDITCVLVFAASRVLHRIRKSHQCCLQHHIGLEHRHAWNKVIRKFVKSMNSKKIWREKIRACHRKCYQTVQPEVVK